MKNRKITPPRVATKSHFSSKPEKLLADNLITFSEKLYGLTSIKFRQVAFELAGKLKIKQIFKKA